MIIYKKFLFVVLFLFNTICVFSQKKYGSRWVTGIINSFEIADSVSDFQFSKYIDTNTTIALSFLGGHSNICDSNGRLLLMSNGYNVIDSNKNFVDGLDSIGGREFMNYNDGFSSYCQYSLFLPMGNGIYYFINNSISDDYLNYYFNTPGANAIYDELLSTKIDIYGNGGAGKVLQREVKIIEHDTLSKTQMMACRHANGRDWWLIKQGFVNNRMHKFLLTKDSVYNYGAESFAGVEFSRLDNGGQSMFSQDGKKFATTNRGTGKIFVADFDRCTGKLSNLQMFNVDSLNAHSPYDTTQKECYTEGLAFSPNGRFIYVYMYFNIQQLDLWDNNPNTRWAVVAGLDTTWDAFQSYSGMYLGPDNKLYMGNWAAGNKQMSYFNNPDAKGLASDFCARCLRMPRFNATRPPNMPNYDLGAMICSSIDSVYPAPPFPPPPPPPPTEQVYLPNAFSPNGDGLNDTWHILNVPELQALGVEVQEVAVYNRWGNEVYKSHNINFSWDGKNHSNDTYFYYIRYRTASGDVKVLKGNINLIR